MAAGDVDGPGVVSLMILNPLTGILHVRKCLGPSGLTQRGSFNVSAVPEGIVGRR
jgi:hypothetical protein